MEFTFGLKIQNIKKKNSTDELMSNCHIKNICESIPLKLWFRFLTNLVFPNIEITDQGRQPQGDDERKSSYFCEYI